MEHLAIMKKSWGLTQKILAGRKKIESRWYKFKRKPWDAIKKGEVIYFKDSGEPVTMKARVSRVLQFSRLTPRKIKELLEEYGDDDGLEPKSIPKFTKLFGDKKYCLLIFLENPEKIKPFQIDKKGFGNMAAWISIDSINKIRVNKK
ncbi:MAG: hypothetical protein PHG23_02395 [Candidatus Pacebacteria bacterium]|nr:hypothetical protein [Candidatus Paceibacterota bacterium]